MERGVSIAKITDNVKNEDAFVVSDNFVAVSDGAGGCGVYADEWSKYLVERLPKDKPILSYEEFDEWIDGIWEEFYNWCYERVQQGDSMLQHKFYNEGSYATVAAVWRVSDDLCRWVAYGDSVVFHYSRETGVLEHSFTRLADFANPPMLVSCKDPLDSKGFRNGEFHIAPSSVVFVASDALSHFIIMMYELSQCNKYSDELTEELSRQTSNANLLETASTMRIDFAEDVIVPLQIASNSEKDFEAFVRKRYNDGILDSDDFTLVFLKLGVEK